MERKNWKVVVAGLALILCVVPVMADVNVQVDANVSSWIGWMNWSDPITGETGASGWGPADLPAVFSGTALTLSPNTNTYNAADPYWVHPDGSGAKLMNANFYTEDTSLVGETVVFTGHTIENTFVNGYTSQAFIKVLDPNQGWATIAEAYAPLVSGQNFEVTLAVDNVAGLVPQYGFVTDGYNADPATVASLGHAMIAIVPEPATLALFAMGGLALVRRRR